MTVTLKLWGGPRDGETRCVDLYPSGRPVIPVTGYLPAKMLVDTRGRPNPTSWVSKWAYPTGGIGRRGWCLAGCDGDHCPNYRRPAPPPPAGGAV